MKTAEPQIDRVGEVVAQAREVDSEHRDVGWLHSTVGDCTATALSDRIVVAAAHCVINTAAGSPTYGIPGKDDQRPDAEVRNGATTFTIDLDGNQYTQADHFTYNLARTYAVMHAGPAYYVTPNPSKPQNDPNSWDLAVMALELPEGTIGPVTRAAAKGRRLLTSYRDTVTPADLADLVFHAQFDPTTTFRSTVIPSVNRVGCGLNDVVLLPDGGINPDASTLSDGGTYSAESQQFRFLAPGVQLHAVNMLDQYLSTPYTDQPTRISSQSPNLASPYIVPGDSGGPMLVASFPELPAGVDALLGVASTGGTTAAPVSNYGTHSVFFHAAAQAWIEQRLRDIKAATANDGDVDGVIDALDNCPSLYNPHQQNTNFETEYELACRAGTCPPNGGASPGPTGLPAALAAWHATFRGDTCDPNSLASVTVGTAPPQYVSPAGTGCFRHVELYNTKLDFDAPCYYISQNDKLVNDGYSGDPVVAVPQDTGKVTHFACNCPASDYAGFSTELARLNQCKFLHGCAIATDTARNYGTLWSLSGYNLVTETDKTLSQGGTDTYPLLFLQPDRTTNPIFGTPEAQRTARWDLTADFARMLAPTTGTYDGMLWAFASGTNRIAAINTPNDYALNRVGRVLDGLTTYQTLPVLAPRIPWYEWVMDPGAHNVQVAQVVSAARQTTGAVRTFSFTNGAPLDTSGSFTAALREEFAGVADQTRTIAFPAPSSRAVAGDQAARALVLNAANGNVTSYIGAFSGTTTTTTTTPSDRPGIYDALPVADTSLLTQPVTASTFDPITGNLAVISGNQLLTRTWNGTSLSSWVTNYATPTPSLAGAVLITPLDHGYRTVVKTTTTLAIIDVDGALAQPQVSWSYAPTNGLWVSRGAKGEVLIAFQRSGGRSGVLKYSGGLTTGYLVSSISGPVTPNAAGGLMAMVDGPAVDPSPRLVDLSTATALTEAGVLSNLSTP